MPTHSPIGLILPPNQHPRHRAQRRAQHRAQHRGGFTLLEKLIVIAILTVLIGLLLPSIGSARAQAKSAACASQLHQIQTASVAWAGQNQKAFSAAGWPDALAPLVVNKRLYICPAEESAGPRTEATVTCALHIRNSNYNIPCVPGPWARQSNVTANSYELSFEDLAASGGGTWTSTTSSCALPPPAMAASPSPWFPNPAATTTI